jgi:5-oxoprolinase (ATP-hydrolysing)
MLFDLSLSQNLPPICTIHSSDSMDDGSPITLALTINRETLTAKFDFSNSGPEVFGNTNAPRSIARSAIIYSLRCLVKSEIPLNQGCLNPVEIYLPDGSILNPSGEAAVVGGNVLTS